MLALRSRTRIPFLPLAFAGLVCLGCVLADIAVTTTLAAAAGALVATLVSWFLHKKPDLSIGLNGAWGGLVGITAGCDCFSAWWSMVVGACAGALVVAGVRLLDRLRIDDPVGAWPVHGLCR